MRIVVKDTFIEVVEEDSSQSVEKLVKRAFSTPAAPTRRDEPPWSRQEREVERLDGSPDVDKQAKEVEGQGGHTPKTTVAIRNVPIHITRSQLLQRLDLWGFAGQYDFLYLPIDFAKFQNFGYAFVNLTTQQHAQRFLAESGGLSWGEHGEGPLVVSWSLSQGLEEHIDRYRNSPLMHESVLDECRPILLRCGVRADFPPPTRKLHRLRRLRTRCGSPGSGGRGVSTRGLAAGCLLIPGLSRAPGGASEEAALTASPLLAGLKRTGTEASAAVPEQRRRERAPKACGAPPAAAAAPARQRTAWADLSDDLDDGLSECSTQMPGSGGLDVGADAGRAKQCT
ncbi:unnamed protein product [Prorocentrum cordatum]|uniref:Mei2-like C-terminal RNA recognition motif domain-containing protein n=1 Tax=Prorocentrum cordatum TaxID=2364126 RepID=A0ABN9VPE4_9DINO|nr:unnamed protein product [Polarella glacialis]